MWKIRTLGTQVYAAAGWKGLVRYDRVNGSGFALDPWSVWQVFPNLGDARALAVVSIDASTTRALVGTVAGTSGPKLYLIDPGDTTPTIKDTEDVPGTPGKEVHVVEAYVHTDGSGAKTIRVLAGTACGGVVRYIVSGPNYDALAPAAASGHTWPSTPANAFVRDIEIDPTRHLAFIGLHGAPNATSMKGVWGLKLEDNGTLTALGSPAWNITPDQINPASDPPEPPKRYYVRSLAYDPVDSRLIVGLGPYYAQEANYVEPCNKLVPCDCGTVTDCNPATDDCGLQEAILGVKAYRIQADPNQTPVHEAGLHVATFEVHALDLAIRRVSEDKYFVDVAADGKGYRLVMGERVGGAWTLEELQPSWGTEADDGAVLNEWDALLSQNARMYASTGRGLATLDENRPVPSFVLQPSNNDLLEQTKDVDLLSDAQHADAAVFITTAFRDSDDRILSAGQGGVRFFNIAGRRYNDPLLIDQDVETSGRAFFVGTAAGFTTLAVPPCNPFRWMYVSHLIDDESATLETGSVGLYCAGSFGASASDDPATVTQLARYVHNNVAAGPHAKFGGIEFVAQTGPPQEHLLYVVYAPTGSSTSEARPGLMTLRAREVAATPGTYEITLVDQDEGIDGTTPCAGSQPGFAVYDPDAPGHPRLYAAFQCNGIAVYDMSVKTNPVREGYWTPPAGQGISVFKVMRGPATGNQHRLMLAGLYHGIGVIEDAFGGTITPSTPVTWYASPFQTAEIVPDGPTLKKWWVGCTQDGLLHADFSAIFP